MKLHTSLFSVGSVKGVGFEPEYISLPKRNLTLPTRVSNPTSDYMQRRCCWQESNLQIRVHIVRVGPTSVGLEPRTSQKHV